MTPRPADRRLTSLPKVPSVKGTRRAQYSASTKRALIDEATRLFSENGYSGTSLDAIVAGAQVTKGALYHHFTGKQGIFEAVFTRIEDEAAKQVHDSIKGYRDPWEKALAGLRGFLEAVREPSYQRVVIQEGPAVLGYERFREQEERSTFASVREIVASVLRSGDFELDDGMRRTFTRIFFGAMSSAGEMVATAEDPALEVARIETAVAFILHGFRALTENEVQLGDPADLIEGTPTTDSAADPTQG